MSLKIQILLSKLAFFPGEAVQASVQVANDPTDVSDSLAGGVQFPIHIKELCFTASGSERTDPSIVQKLHHPEVIPEKSDGRRRLRSIFSTERTVLATDQHLAPQTTQQFFIRFQLPGVLPPTFRGSAVRFAYTLEVQAEYEVSQGLGKPAVAFETTATAPLTVWPGSGTLHASRRTGTADRADQLAHELSRSSSIAGHGKTPMGALPTQPSPAGPASMGGSQVGSSGGIQQSTGTSARSGLQQQGQGQGQAATPRAAAGSQQRTSGSGAGSGGGGGIASGSISSGQPPEGTSSVASNTTAVADDSDLALIDYRLSRGVSQLKWQALGVQPMGGYPGSGMRPMGHTLTGMQDASNSSLSHAAGSISHSSSGIPSSPAAAIFTALSPMVAPSLGAAFTGGGLLPGGVSGGQPFSGDSAAAAAAAALAGGYDSDEDVGSLGGRPSHPGSDLQRHVQRQTSGGGSAYARVATKLSVFGRPYILNVGDQPLLRVMLQTPLDTPLQPGATFGGVLALQLASSSCSSSPGSAESPRSVCHNVVVMLESEEVVASEHRSGSKLRLLPGAGSSQPQPYIIRKLHAEQHEMTSDVSVTSFQFTLPSSATPSFRTPVVALRWVLRFEFTVGPPLNWSAPDRARAGQGKAVMSQLMWSLPLVVRPPTVLRS